MAREGLNFQRTKFIVHTHAPHLWQKMNSLDLVDSVEDLVIDYLVCCLSCAEASSWTTCKNLLLRASQEAESLKMADAVVSPTKYMMTILASSNVQVTP